MISSIFWRIRWQFSKQFYTTSFLGYTEWHKLISYSQIDFLFTFCSIIRKIIVIFFFFILYPLTFALLMSSNFCKHRVKNFSWWSLLSCIAFSPLLHVVILKQSVSLAVLIKNFLWFSNHCIASTKRYKMVIVKKQVIWLFITIVKCVWQSLRNNCHCLSRCWIYKKVSLSSIS